MRLFSEEYKLGTIETLMTAPVRDGQVVLAKFLGSLFFYIVLWAPSLLYFAIFRWISGQSAAESLGALHRRVFNVTSGGNVLPFDRMPGIGHDEKSNRRRHGHVRRDISVCFFWVFSRSCS